MYPSDELKRLHLRKELLRVQSTLLRTQCIAAVSELAPPVILAEGWVGTLKKLFPYFRFASLFFSFKRERSGGILSLVRTWAPILLQAFKWFRPKGSSPNPPPDAP